MFGYFIDIGVSRYNIVVTDLVGSRMKENTYIFSFFGISKEYTT